MTYVAIFGWTVLAAVLAAVLLLSVTVSAHLIMKKIREFSRRASR